MGEKRNAYRISVGRPEKMRLLRTCSRHGRENNIEMDLNEIMFEYVD
jgi:hypothetical protein